MNTKKDGEKSDGVGDESSLSIHQSHVSLEDRLNMVFKKFKMNLLGQITVANIYIYVCVCVCVL